MAEAARSAEVGGAATAEDVEEQQMRETSPATDVVKLWNAATTPRSKRSFGSTVLELKAEMEIRRGAAVNSRAGKMEGEARAGKLEGEAEAGKLEGEAEAGEIEMNAGAGVVEAEMLKPEADDGAVEVKSKTEALGSGAGAGAGAVQMQNWEAGAGSQAEARAGAGAVQTDMQRLEAGAGSQGEARTGSQAEAGAGSQAEAGAGSQTEAGAGSQAEAGAGSQAEAASQAEAGAGSQAEAGAGSQAQAGAGAIKVETKLRWSTSVGRAVEEMEARAKAAKSGLTRSGLGKAKDTDALGTPGDVAKDQDVPIRKFRLQLKELMEAFQVFDADRSGMISADELCLVFKSIGQELSEEEVRMMIDEVDSNGSGTLEFIEFVRMMERSVNGKSSIHKKLYEAFQFFDKSGDGRISAEELQEALKDLRGQIIPLVDIKFMMRKADIDRDGHISFKEFLKLIAAT